VDRLAFHEACGATNSSGSMWVFIELYRSAHHAIKRLLRLGIEGLDAQMRILRLIEILLKS